MRRSLKSAQVPRPAYRASPRHIYSWRATVEARSKSGLSRIPAVPRPGSEGQSLAQLRTSFASSAPTLRPWNSSSADLSPRGRARAVRAFSYRHSAQSGFPGADRGADANRDAARKPRPERRANLSLRQAAARFVAPSARRVNSSWRGGPAAHSERRDRAYRPPRHR